MFSVAIHLSNLEVEVFGTSVVSTTVYVGHNPLLVTVSLDPYTWRSIVRVNGTQVGNVITNSSWGIEYDAPFVLGGYAQHSGIVADWNGMIGLTSFYTWPWPMDPDTVDQIEADIMDTWFSASESGTPSSEMEQIIGSEENLKYSQRIDSSSPSKMAVPVVVGIVCGGVSAIGIILGISVYYLRRKTRFTSI